MATNHIPQIAIGHLPKQPACCRIPHRRLKTLLVIVGPTGVGKTALSIGVAQRLGCPIVNADSRQIYRELPIGTAAPTEAEQALVPHYFVGTHSIEEDYNAGQYERDAIALLTQLFEHHDTIVMSGGSMMYVKAVCEGLDEMPEVATSLRAQLRNDYEQRGLAWLQEQVKQADPAYWEEVDQSNPQRLLHALEVCIASGQPFSSFRKGGKKERPFRIIKIGITRDREELYSRINQRVLQMIDEGLQQEVERVIAFRHCNSLQTVGYKEMFRYIDGDWSLDEAIRMIQQNSRHYAKRQLTWYRADEAVEWIDLSHTPADQAIERICQKCNH